MQVFTALGEKTNIYFVFLYIPEVIKSFFSVILDEEILMQICIWGWVTSVRLILPVWYLSQYQKMLYQAFSLPRLCNSSYLFRKQLCTCTWVKLIGKNYFGTTFLDANLTIQCIVNALEMFTLLGLVIPLLECILCV